MLTCASVLDLMNSAGDSGRLRRAAHSTKVETLTEFGRHADGGNLYLSISPAGRRWVFYYRFRGRRREMGLGSAAKGMKTLAKARTKADATAKAKRLNPQALQPTGLFDPTACPT